MAFASSPYVKVGIVLYVHAREGRSDETPARQVSVRPDREASRPEAWAVPVLALVRSGAFAAILLKRFWVRAPKWLSAAIGLALG
jgi:hypothetical protein